MGKTMFNKNIHYWCGSYHYLRLARHKNKLKLLESATRIFTKKMTKIKNIKFKEIKIPRIFYREFTNES
jgi:hypothetical protein